MTFAETLRDMHSNGAERAKIMPEAALSRLNEAAVAYAKPNPFKIGDIVTPRKGSSVKDPGDPHIVIDVVPDAKCVFLGSDDCTNSFGRRLDIRVLCIMDHSDNIAAVWCESWEYEPYLLPLPVTAGSSGRFTGDE